jgi:hypothetical protein
MNTEALIYWASYITLNRRNFIPIDFGRTDPMVVVCLDKLQQSLEELPDDIELPAERLSILDD